MQGQRPFPENILPSSAFSRPDAIRTAGMRALFSGELAFAFACFDRLCRTAMDPEAADWLARALVHRRCGHAAAFVQDLDRAMRTGWCEPLILRTVAALHPDKAERHHAATALVAGDRSSSDDIDHGLIKLSDLAVRVALRVERHPTGLGGFVASRPGDAPALAMRVGDDPCAVRLEPPVEHPGAPGWRLQGFDIPASPDRPVELTVHLDGRIVEQTTDIPRGADTPRRTAADPEAPISADIVVVVPIFADPATLRMCLDSLQAQTSRCRVHHILVDDDARDPEVTRLGRAFCDAVAGTFIRLPVNAGFAAAVNAGLARIAAGAALLLNSDVVLPAGALDRLHAASCRDTRIGTVGAFSNDAGSASFPKPFERNPLLDARAAAAVDRVAAQTNAGRVVDVIGNLGSCLLITEACRRAVGLFSHAYGRGYYEDVDYCLRAREAGFRNVVASDVYVAHASSRSFGVAKRRLAAENRLVVESRFPGLDAAEQTFMRADPLRDARSAIEERLPPDEPVTLLLAGQGSEPELFRPHDPAFGAACRTLVLRWVVCGGVTDLTITDRAGAAPQSLRFRLDAGGCERLAVYLGRLAICGVDTAGTAVVPPDLRRLLEGRMPRRAVVEAPRWGDPTPDEARAPARPVAVTRLGVLLPFPCARAERFVLGLARAARRAGRVQLAVLGTCLDEAQLMAVGNAWVHGPVPPWDLATVTRAADLQALLIPYRDHAPPPDAAEGGLPRAFFAGADPARRPAPADLALPARLDDRSAGVRLQAWCDGAPAALDA